MDRFSVTLRTNNLEEAKKHAPYTYLEYRFRHKNDLRIVIKKFSDVARLAIPDMRKQLGAGLGKRVYEDYIVCIERYLIPFFGAQGYVHNALDFKLSSRHVLIYH